MKLTVNVDELKNKINIALEQYHKDYIVLLKKYATKLSEYQIYITKEVDRIEKGTKPGKELKYPPNQPSNSTHNLIKHLNGLNMHQSKTIDLTTDELNDITSGIERLHDNVANTTYSLNAVSYSD